MNDERHTHSMRAFIFNKTELLLNITNHIQYAKTKGTRLASRGGWLFHFVPLSLNSNVRSRATTAHGLPPPAFAVSYSHVLSLSFSRTTAAAVATNFQANTSNSHTQLPLSSLSYFAWLQLHFLSRRLCQHRDWLNVDGASNWSRISHTRYIR